jgi:cob(I)alamin adenosyltransferase
MKIYTKQGDDGTTGLFGGDRVPKDDLRVQAYGAVDELNSALGLAHARVFRAETRGQDSIAIDEVLKNIQIDLFVLGADLATPKGKETSYLPRLDNTHVEALERLIDELDGQLPELKNFILPGGGSIGSILHYARAVCRRAERLTVTLARAEDVSAIGLQYLNRLGDLLFVLARYANQAADVQETEWAPRKEG